METLNKASMFDLCINGDRDKYKSLCEEAFGQFNSFYEVFKTNFGDTENDITIIYTKQDDDSTRFSIICNNKEIESFEIPIKYKNDITVNVTRTSNSIEVNVKPHPNNIY